MSINATVGNNVSSVGITTTRVVLTSVFITIVMLATIIGNTLVIFCVCYFPRLRGRTNYLIVSLAVADLLVGTLSLPLRLIQTVNRETWPLGGDACHFWIWIDMLCSAASILSLTGISFDRLIAIVDPLKYEERMRPLLVYFMIGITWLFALSCASLSFAKWAEIDISRQCSIKSKEYITFVSVAAFFVPLAIVLVNYGIIFRIAMKHAQRLQKVNRSLASNFLAETAVDTNHNPDASEGESQNSFLKRSVFSFRKVSKKPKSQSAKFSLVKQLKATKTLAVVIGVFCVCWFPFFVIFITFQYCGNRCFEPPRMSAETRDILITIFVNVLPVANSAANPLIYSCFNAEFRKAFKRILAKILNRKSSLDAASTTFSAVPSSVQKDFERSSA